MWSYIKIPNIAEADAGNVIRLQEYKVSEGQVIEVGDLIAVALSEGNSLQIISNYRGRILRLLLPAGASVSRREPFATLELLQDPIDGLLMADYRLIGAAR